MSSAHADEIIQAIQALVAHGQHFEYPKTLFVGQSAYDDSLTPDELAEITELNPGIEIVRCSDEEALSVAIPGFTTTLVSPRILGSQTRGRLEVGRR